MAKNVKKAKKGLSPRTKEVLGLTFKSLFSNAAVVDASKNAPWWIALIFFLIGVFLPIIPVMTYYGNLTGGGFLTGTRYGMNENAVTNSFYDLNVNSKYEFKIDGSNELAMYINNVETSRPAPSEGQDPYADGFDTYPIYRYITHDTKEGNPWNQFMFEVYFTNRTFVEDENKNSVLSLITTIDERKYKGGTLDLVDPEVPLEEGEYSYAPSYIIFHKAGLYARINKIDTTTAAVASYTANSNWQNTSTEGFMGVLDRVLSPKNAEGQLIDRNLSNPVYLKGVIENLKVVFDETYLAFKTGALWINFGIYESIFIGLVLFMGFLLWLLTRGKKNMFNYLSIWTTIKMGWWSCLTPGIIAMIVGFIFTNQSLMIFIMTVGIRVMWMSMKQLRPQ